MTKSGRLRLGLVEINLLAVFRSLRNEAQIWQRSARISTGRRDADARCSCGCREMGKERGSGVCGGKMFSAARRVVCTMGRLIGVGGCSPLFWSSFGGGLGGAFGLSCAFRAPVSRMGADLRREGVGIARTRKLPLGERERGTFR